MLRFDYMPSDFHPLFLFLGEAADLAALAGALKEFAAEPRELVLAERLPRALSRTALSLVPADSQYGMRLETGGAFRWNLNAWQAEQLAERIDALSDTAHKSGSDIFELGVEGEIPVKVSRGEFTDDFLVTSGLLSPNSQARDGV